MVIRTGMYRGYHYRGVSWLSVQGCIVVIITGVYQYRGVVNRFVMSVTSRYRDMQSEKVIRIVKINLRTLEIGGR